MKFNTLFVVAALVAGGLFLSVQGAPAQAPWDAPAEWNSYDNPVAVSADSLSKGKKLYLTHCQVCHGKNGDGTGPSARTSNIKPADFTDPDNMKQSDGSLAYKIMTGRGPMPSWAPVLTDENDLWSMINYIRQFSK